LTCWNEENEGTEILCQGAIFGSGETQFMDGTTIKVSGENDEILLSSHLNRQGQTHFPRPEGKFHVLLEDRP
jgi:hypothetical protein